jgi:GNAT superfamily N-acetyltransferase
METSLSIRPATPEDLPLILRFIHLKAAFDGCLETVEATPERLSEALFGDAPTAGVLFAEVAGEPVGFASYYRTYSTFLARPGIWLDDLFVVEPMRSQGIGKILLAHLAAMVEEMGGGRLEWTAARTNERGLSFYQRNGAKRQDTVHLMRLDRPAIAAMIALPLDR